jgi:hypothetical protein
MRAPHNTNIYASIHIYSLFGMGCDFSKLKVLVESCAHRPLFIQFNFNCSASKKCNPTYCVIDE